VWATRETFAGADMRVGWWRPGRGARHPAVLFVIGATPLGIDFPELRVAAEAFARAGLMVMIPEVPSLIEERLDTGASAQIAAAFRALRADPAAREPVGAFGFSIGGGILFAAAGTDPALRAAPYLATVGAYFDIYTYMASVLGRAQQRASGRVAWRPSPDVPGRTAGAARSIAADRDEQEALSSALAATSYDDALARLNALPVSLRLRLDALSPSRVWERIGAPVFWLHDANDPYVPVAEAEAARAARLSARLTLLVPRLLQHAVPVSDLARRAGPRFWLGELRALLRFARSVLRAAA